MKPLITAFFLALLFSLLFSCQRKQYSFQSMPETYVVFGNGGGFAGAVHEFYLFPDGQVIELSGMQQDTIFYEQINKKTARNVIDSCIALPLQELMINEPGNTYSFIRQVHADTTNSATWGNYEYKPPTDITGMYTRLKQLVVPEEANE